MPSLILSNKHLATPAKRIKAVYKTIATSSAIEGIYAPFKAGKVARSIPKQNTSAKSVKLTRGRREKTA